MSYRDRALSVILSAAGGVGLAVVAEYLFFVGPLAWLNLVVWALLAVTAGALSRTVGRAVTRSATAGFVIVVAYSVLGYQGISPIITVIPSFAVLGVIGAMAMTLASLTGVGLRRTIRGSRPG